MKPGLGTFQTLSCDVPVLAGIGRLLARSSLHRTGQFGPVTTVPYGTSVGRVSDEQFRCINFLAAFLLVYPAQEFILENLTLEKCARADAEMLTAGVAYADVDR